MFHGSHRSWASIATRNNTEDQVIQKPGQLKRQTPPIFSFMVILNSVSHSADESYHLQLQSL